MILTVENVTKCFSDKYAVKDFDVEFKNGVNGLLGANGSGKTTLLRLITDILNPSSGRVLLDGVNIKALGERYREKLGYLPQTVGIYREFSCIKYLLYISALKGISGKKAKDRCEELLEIVDLSDVKKMKLKRMSGGMIRRVGIAQALLNDPKILILDEPTAGLDPKERIKFRNLISEISNNKIIILSTHIVSDIESIANEIIIMKEGIFIDKSSPSKLIEKIDGKVWNVSIDKSKLLEYQKKYYIRNIFNKKDKIQLKIVSDYKPNDLSVPATPNLEDVYLYYFGGTERC